MLKGVLLVALMTAPVALAAPLPGAAECVIVNDTLDQANEDIWYETCGRVMSLGAEPSLTYSQATLGCEGNTCNYRPKMEIALDALAPGKWILRATSQERHYPSYSVIAGSQRSLECTLEGPDASCAASVNNRDVSGNPFNSARWEGTWSLFFVDALGVQHLQATGEADGWLAQYY